MIHLEPKSDLNVEKKRKFCFNFVFLFHNSTRFSARKNAAFQNLFNYKYSQNTYYFQKHIYFPMQNFFIKKRNKLYELNNN